MQDSPPPGLFEVVYTARALRRLKPDPIPDEVLFQLLDAAIRAPSGQNAQDWRFVIITDEAVRQQLQGWAKEGWSRYQPGFAEQPSEMDGLPKTQRLSLKSVAYLVQHLSEAPAIIAVCGRKGRHSSPGGSTFPAVQNLLLAARALGLGASIFNLPLLRSADLVDKLGVPEANQIYCLVPIGYPKDRHGPVRRKPVAKVTFWNRWGKSWDYAERQPEVGWQEKWIPRGEQ